MAKKILLITLSLFLVLSLFSCNDEKEGSEGITVVATLFPQYDFARAVLGDKGNVKLLLTPGADSHSFELTASDISDINCCDIFVYTGPNMEIWVDGIVDSISNRVNIVNLSVAIDLSHGDDNIDNNDEHEHNHGNDPHIWTSPVIAIDMLTKIYSAICEVDEENTECYTANYNAYKSQLEALDQEFRNISSNSKEKTLYLVK